MTTRKLQTLQGAKVVPIESENETLDFASVRIGAAKAVLSEIDAQTLGIDRKIRAVDGTDALDVATKGQVDSVASAGTAAAEALQENIDDEEAARQGADSALQSNIDDEASARATADGTLQDNIDAEEGARIAADSALDDRLTTTEDDVNDIQGDLAAILANNPKQKRFVVPASLPNGGVSAGAVGTVFDTSTSPAFTFDADATVLDIELWIGGARWVQCIVGDFSTGGFRKNSDHAIETSQVIPENAEVVVWKQGTSSAGGGGGSDLDAITTDPRPAVAGDQTLGTLAKPWGSLYLKDTVTSQVYRFEIISGVVQATLVP